LGNTADVRSIDALKDFRAVLALYAEEAQGAIGSAKIEAKRAVYWLRHDRKLFWTEQIRRRRLMVAETRAELNRLSISTSSENSMAMSEARERVRKAEMALREAEAKTALIKKWEPILQVAVLELYASLRRITDLSSTDVVRASVLLGKLVDTLEAYARDAPPAALSQFKNEETEAIVAAIVAEEAAKDLQVDEAAANQVESDLDLDLETDPGPEVDSGPA
jgi:hypothetical protein